MENNKNKVGIITFHHSYNCGSMLQTFALQSMIKKLGFKCEIINFSNEGQKKVYSVLPEGKDLKNRIKRFILNSHKDQIETNFKSYENFIDKYFTLSKDEYTSMDSLTDDKYDFVIAGSDQVWNITIDDGDDAYFLPWVKKAKKIAYAPSFGARCIQNYANDVKKYKEYLNDFDYISIREENGKKWIKDLIGKNVPVLLDPTLLLDSEEYDEISLKNMNLPEKYIFYYSPGYLADINKLTKKISKKYNLPVIAFNAKTFYTKKMDLSSFKLPEIENPSSYLYLIKHASLVITTSFHGTIFSTIYNKKFWTIKNGEMAGNDDRVKTLMDKLELNDRMISMNFDKNFDYMKPINYNNYCELLKPLQEEAINYLIKSLKD